MGFTLHLNVDGNISRPTLALPARATHKYGRGHAMVLSGPMLHTGASRLVAQAALAVGAGLVTIFGDKDALAEQAAHVTAIMLQERDGNFDFIDDRVRALAVGPGAGISPGLAEDVLALLSMKLPIVLDADALTCFASKPDVLFASLHRQAVLTPHEGEFLRLFPDLLLADRFNAARAAAVRAESVVLLKGSQTIVAAPDGLLAVNCHSSPWLATAGSGDVLTGIICGLLAQGQDAFEAAAIGVWLHGDIGIRFGPGLTADKMVDLIPEVLKGCFSDRKRLLEHDWPGNARELRNYVFGAVLDLPREALSSNSIRSAKSLATRVGEFEKMVITETLQATGGNVVRACKILGTARKTLYEKLSNHQIDPARFRHNHNASQP